MRFWIGKIMGKEIWSFKKDHLLTGFLEWVTKIIKIYSYKDGYPGLHPKWWCNPKEMRLELFQCTNQTKKDHKSEKAWKERTLKDWGEENGWVARKKCFKHYVGPLQENLSNTVCFSGYILLFVCKAFCEINAKTSCLILSCALIFCACLRLVSTVVWGRIKQVRRVRPVRAVAVQLRLLRAGSSVSCPYS